MKNFVFASLFVCLISASLSAQEFGGGGFFGGLAANVNIIRSSGGIDLTYGNVAAVANIVGGGGYRHYVPGGYYRTYAPAFQPAYYGNAGYNSGYYYHAQPCYNAYPYGSIYSGSVAPSDMGLPGTVVYQQLGIPTTRPTQYQVQQRTNAIYQSLYGR